MAMKTYPTTVKDGKVYAEVTLRDVVEHNDVSDLPMLSEIKRLYSENDKLKEQVKTLDRIAKGNLVSAADHERLLEAENDRLRELSKWAILCSEGDVRCEGCPYHNEVNSLMTCKMRADAIKLGVEL